MDIQTFLLAIVGILALVAAYFKNRADKSGTAALEGEVKGEDKQLSAQQGQVEKKIDDIEKRDDSNLTPDERADRWNK